MLGFGLINTEHLTGSETDNFVTLHNSVSGLDVNLGGGVNDTLIITGTNSLNLTGVENIANVGLFRRAQCPDQRCADTAQHSQRPDRQPADG